MNTGIKQTLSDPGISRNQIADSKRIKIENNNNIDRISVTLNVKYSVNNLISTHGKAINVKPKSLKLKIEYSTNNSTDPYS